MVKKTVQHLRSEPAPGPAALNPPASPASPASDNASQKLSPAAKRAALIRGEMKRETVESIVVAIILALLFRGFVAEMFVIPTGSMAPALMGAHKDIFCPECGHNYQASSSIEDRVDWRGSWTVVGTICENCRYAHGLDLEAGKNDATFSGDRIMVSKFSYTLFEPQRWDVAVFKFPGNPKQNYIKRVVGLPNESVLIHHGDIYVRPGAASDDPVITNQEFQLQRKPTDKLLAMAHHLYDSQHQSALLNEAGYPSPWQPWPALSKDESAGAWQTSVEDGNLVAKATASANDKLRYLRYFHRPPTFAQWDQANRGLSLRDVDPYECRAVTDFYAYNAFIKVDEEEVYDVSPKQAGQRSSGLGRLGGLFSGPAVRFRPGYQSGDLSQFENQWSIGSSGYAMEGMHWVGDLIAEWDLETSEDATACQFRIIEAGIAYVCDLELKSGTATLRIVDKRPDGAGEAAKPEFTDGTRSAVTVSGPSGVLAGERHQIRFSNADDQLRLWVDDELVEFDGPTTFDHRQYLSEQQDRPYYTEADPLDAAPVMLGIRGGEATAHHMKVMRDKYYIALRGEMQNFHDYDAPPSFSAGEPVDQQLRIQRRLSTPSTWGDSTFWNSRRTVVFEMGADQFFPLGDNSPESKDARCWVDSMDVQRAANSPDPYAYHWASEHFVPRDLLVGKAIAVFWPHTWNTGMRLNLSKIRLIR